MQRTDTQVHGAIANLIGTVFYGQSRMEVLENMLIRIKSASNGESTLGCI